MSKDFNSKIAETALALAIESCGPKKWWRTVEVASIYYDFLTGKTLERNPSKLEKLLNLCKYTLTKSAE